MMLKLSVKSSNRLSLDSVFVGTMENNSEYAEYRA